MTKKTTSFRLSDQTREQLEILAPLFKETQTELLERAVDLLFRDRERIAKEDMNQRLNDANRAKP